MLIYAGIDEAGYGPFFGPMTVGCSVFRIPNADGPGDGGQVREGARGGTRAEKTAGAGLPDLWARLNRAVSPTLTGRKGRVVVADSKKLKTKAAGIGHLETGCLAFAGLWDGLASASPRADTSANIMDLAGWTEVLGERSHRDLAAVPWYSVSEAGPWETLPARADAGELAIARGMLRQTAGRIGVEVADLRCAVVLEDRFNRMVATTRSKAAVNFTFIAGHLRHIWEHHGNNHPVVVVDRQSGRMRYRDLLAMTFPETRVSVNLETTERSSYQLDHASPSHPLSPRPKNSATSEPMAPSQPRGRGGGGTQEGAGEVGPKGGPEGWGEGGRGGGRAMTVRFETRAETGHLPVALASMLAKYNRELWMGRFNRTFGRWLPSVAPTAGYGTDAKRFWQEVQPELARLGIDPRALRRQA